MAQIRLYLDEADGDLPNACMRCGDEATVTKTKNMQWTPPWVGVLILAGLLPYVIVAMIMTKRARLQAPFCDQHSGHWLNRTLLILGSAFALGMLSIASFVLLAVVPVQHRDDFFGLACAASIAMFIAWVIILAFAQGTAIRCKEITEDEMVLDGVSRDFVELVEDERDNRRARRRKAKRRYEDEDDDYDERPRKKKKRPSSDAFEE